MRFEALDFEGLAHCFSLRYNEWPEHLAKDASRIIQACAMPVYPIVQAEQTHGCEVALVDKSHFGQIISGCDALVTSDPHLCLVIRTADCGPIFIYDPINKVIALAHSGRKGTELNIVGRTISSMEKNYRTCALDLIVVLGPCVRPPNYEVDFARQIAAQCLEKGVVKFYDCGHNTGADLTRFYSYRVEKGKTGRHYSAICMKE